MFNAALPKISVIVPVYKVENYLHCCLDSILAQSYTEFELLLIDDGSPDNCGKICDEYAEKDSRVRVFHVENGGPSRARNIGLDNAHGDWVIFVDADDWLEQGFMVKLGIGDNNLPDIMFWGFNRCFEDGNVKVCSPKDFEVVEDKDSIINQLLYLFNSNEQFFGFTWNKIFRRSIIEKVNLRFEERLKTREDELFTLNYCCHINSIKILSYAPYNYRILSNSLSHNSDKELRNYCLLASKECEILSFFRDTCLHESLASRIYTYYASSISECLFFKREELKQVIDKTILFFDTYCDFIKIPIWQKLILEFPLKSVRGKLLYTSFKIRLILKDKI